jgi:GNAT superfamily N-acetyltransferase
VLDCLGEIRVEEIVGLFTAVGFGAPPSWLKPHHVLSGGERFRCDLARALAAAMIAARVPAGGKRRKGGAQTMAAGRARSLARLPLVAFDEFTSAVDRRAAQIASAALVKALRGGGIHCRFVAITCHYDVAEWLEPDWVVDTGPGTTHWRQLRRPAIELSVFRCRQRAWRLFARHHYLSGSLNFGSRCFLACWSDTPVAFCATLPLLGRRGVWRISRLVTLPDYQGIGIGTRLAEAVGDLHRQQGDRLRLTTSHPAMLSHCSRSAHWQFARVMKNGSHKCGFTSRYTGSTGRSVTSFEYLGPAVQATEGTLPPGGISTTQSNGEGP